MLLFLWMVFYIKNTLYVPQSNFFSRTVGTHHVSIA